MGWKFFKPYNEDSIFVTSLPSNPSDGQQVVLVDSLTAPTYAWRLAYMAAKASNRWLFVGGEPAVEQGVSGSSTSSSGTAQGTGITLPVAGTYDILFGGDLSRQTTTEWLFVSLKVGNGTTFTNSIDWQRSTTSNESLLTLSKAHRLSGLAASTVIRLYLANSNGTSQVNLGDGFLFVTPVSIGG